MAAITGAYGGYLNTSDPSCWPATLTLEGNPLGSGHLCVKRPPLGLVQAWAGLGPPPLAARGAPMAGPARHAPRRQGQPAAGGRPRTNAPAPARARAPAAAGLWGPRARAGREASAGDTSGPPRRSVGPPALRSGAGPPPLAHPRRWARRGTSQRSAGVGQTLPPPRPPSGRGGSA